MTRVKDLEAENQQLKIQVSDLKKELECYTKKDHETSQLSQRLSITHYDDGRYMVAGPISKTQFHLGRKEELDYMIERASFQTKELYIKNALDWMIEDDIPSSFGDIKIYPVYKLPANTVICNPNLYNQFEELILKNGHDYFLIDHELKKIVEKAREARGVL